MTVLILSFAFTAAMTGAGCSGFSTDTRPVVPGNFFCLSFTTIVTTSAFCLVKGTINLVCNRKRQLRGETSLKMRKFSKQRIVSQCDTYTMFWRSKRFQDSFALKQEATRNEWKSAAIFSQVDEETQVVAQERKITRIKPTHWNHDWG